MENKFKLSEKEKDNFEANFRKLWLIDKVNCPFMASVTSFQKRHKLPVKCNNENYHDKTSEYINFLKAQNKHFFNSVRFSAFVPMINEIRKLDVPNESKKKAIEDLVIKQKPYELFIKEVKDIMSKFGFEDFWLESFLIYLITNKIFPPYQNKSDNVPPDSILVDWRIFILNSKKEAQNDFLKKFWKLSNRQAYELPEKSNLLPDKYLHTQLNIADKIWGEPGEKEDISISDRKKIQNIKKRISRFRKYFVPCTEKDFAKLR